MAGGTRTSTGSGAPPALREHSAEDHGALWALWADDAGGAALGLSAADAPAGIAQFLARNPGLSFGLWEGQDLVGSVLAGHDGRRGYLYHLVVRGDRRQRGFGRVLVERALIALASAGVQKTHVMVYAANTDGRSFWEHLGFLARDELVVLSKETEVRLDAAPAMSIERSPRGGRWEAVEGSKPWPL